MTTAKAGALAYFIFQAGAQADGGLNSVSELIAEQAAVRRVLIFTNMESRFADRWRKAGCEVSILGMNEDKFHSEGQGRSSKVSRIVNRLGNNLRLAKILKAENVEVLHANDSRSFWSAVVAAKLSGVPIILNVRDAMPPSYTKAPLRWKLAYQLCDLFLVLSKDMEQYWAKLLGVGARNKVRHLYSIVRTPAYAIETDRAALRQELGLSPSEYVIAYVASFHPKKQQAGFIRHAAKPILDQIPNGRIVFVGDYAPAENPAAAEAGEAAEALGVGNRLHFAGFSAEPWRWYAAADLIVLASEREGLPRCLIESMCVGAPFASFDVSSAQEMADLHDAASVAPLNNYEALVRAVVDRHAAAETDLARRADLGVAARKLFDAETARRLYEQFLRDLGKSSERFA